VNHTSDMIQFTQSAAYGSASPPPGWPLPLAVLDTQAAAGRGIPSEFTYANFDRIRDRGIELAVQAPLRGGATTFANYSWQARPAVSGFDESEINRQPAHRLNVGASLARGRYFGSASANYISSAFWQDVDPRYVGESPSYVLVNAGAGLHSSDQKMTVAVRANNLFNNATPQHVFGDIIKRIVTGEVRLRF
jgi:hypothetical protein